MMGELARALNAGGRDDRRVAGLARSGSPG